MSLQYLLKPHFEGLNWNLMMQKLLPLALCGGTDFNSLKNISEPPRLIISSGEGHKAQMKHNQIVHKYDM